MGFELKILVVPVFIFLSFSLSAQNPCEKVYESSAVDIPAEMPLTQQEFMKFVMNEIAPIISKEMEKPGVGTISKLYIDFTISEKGEITEVEFPHLAGSPEFHMELAKAFLKTGTWKPALKDGKTVCSEFIYPISCLKWQ